MAATGRLELTLASDDEFEAGLEEIRAASRRLAEFNRREVERILRDEVMPEAIQIAEQCERLAGTFDRKIILSLLAKLSKWERDNLARFADSPSASRVRAMLNRARSALLLALLRPSPEFEATPVVEVSLPRRPQWTRSHQRRGPPDDDEPDVVAVLLFGGAV
jgi:hypothetical protein